MFTPKLFLLSVILFNVTNRLNAQTGKDIQYGQADNTKLLLDANTPDGRGPFPIVILVHGGGWGSGDKAGDPAPLLKPLTEAHFAWFSINYRLAPKNHWPACYDDLNTAIRWVKKNAGEYRGDPNHIALIGYSAGGHLVCLAGTQTAPDVTVQAVVGLSPPTDLELDLPIRGGLSISLQNLLNEPKIISDDSRKRLRELSSINHLHAGMPPFLLLHGTADKSVLYEDSVNFQSKLRALKVPCTLITLKDAPHRLSEWDKYDSDYQSKIVDWLSKTLQSPSAPASGPVDPRKARG